MTLAIISHTEHYKNTDGTILGWGPTISEINHLLEIFDTIYHVAMLHDTLPPPSSLPYKSNKIVFVPLPALGGTTMSDKLKIVLKADEVIRIINITLKKVDYFQLRTPTGIGVYLIPYLTFLTKKTGWYKYAGNWNQKNPPLGYGLQRWMLKKQNRKVTINGKWADQPANCITFENPCLTNNELIEGIELVKQKSIDGILTCCYVGRLEKPKGVERIIKAISGLPVEEKNLIDKVHLVGDGTDLNYFKDLASESNVDFVFHGFLSRQEVFKIYKKSQAFLMPTTASEGFPKVIAEAMNFGCIPIVSNISSIGQYIKNMETGICLNEITTLGLQIAISQLLTMKNDQFQAILMNQRDVVKKFSFHHYNHRIKTEIVSKTLGSY